MHTGSVRIDWANPVMDGAALLFGIPDIGRIEVGDLHMGELVPTPAGKPEEIPAVTIPGVPNPLLVHNFVVDQER